MDKKLPSNHTGKQYEKTLAESALNLQKLTDNLPVLLAQLDTENRFLFANVPFMEWFSELQACGLSGKTLEEVIGGDALAIHARSVGVLS